MSRGRERGQYGHEQQHSTKIPKWGRGADIPNSKNISLVGFQVEIFFPLKCLVYNSVTCNIHE